MNIRYLPTLLTLLIVWAASCKKSDNTSASSTPGNTKLATVLLIDSNTNDMQYYRITYNAQNQVDFIIQTSNGFVEIATFAYGSLSYTRSWTGGGGQGTDVITTNADGTIQGIIGNPYDTFFFAYNSNGLVQTTDNNYAETYITNYTWVNGDIDNASTTPSGFGSVLYYYDYTHLWQMGDAFSILDFLSYGRPTARSKHLLTGKSTNNVLEKYVYKFDSQSRITQLTEPGEGVIYYYTYTN